MRKAAKRTATPATPAPTMAFVEDEFEDRKATASEIRAHADALRTHAEKAGVTDLRLFEDGTMVVHSEGPGYREVFDFSFLASESVGYYVHVITDDAPGAVGADPL